MTKFEYEIKKEDEGLEIRWILRHKYKFSSRLRSKLKFGKLVFLNGVETPGWVKVKEGDLLTIKLPEESSNFEPEDITLEIAYEDSDLLVINKQNGITVHPTKGCPSHTLANGIMKYILDTKQSFKIRFVNRLDTDTSGLLIIAKNSYSQNHITNQMRRKTVVKRYKALVSGSFVEKKFTVNLPIGRPSEDDIRRAVMMENGSPSITHVKVLEEFNKKGKNYSLLELQLETGRTHQIRVHLSHIGHPIIGDSLYDGEEVLDESGASLITRQALHSYHLEFIHPTTELPLVINAPLSDDIHNLIEYLKA